MTVTDYMAMVMENITAVIHDKVTTDSVTPSSKRNKGHKSFRGKGEGTLKLRGGIYHAQWTVKGKTYSRSTKTGNKREALAKLEEYIAPFRAGNEKAVLENFTTRMKGLEAEIAEVEAKKPALLICVAWDAYEKAPNRPDSGESTLEGYGSQYKIFVEWIKEKHPNIEELREVTQEIADEFINYIGSTRSANTYNKYKTFFSCMWEVLKEVGKLTLNPWVKIRRKVDIGHSRRELTVEEVSRVIGSAEGEMKVLFAIAIYTGLRLGDCALLEWGQVDLVRQLISVVPRKTARHSHGKTTVIPMHASLVKILTTIDDRVGYVLPTIAETYQRNTSLVTRHIQKHFRACGIKTTVESENGMCKRVDVGFHSFRHTFVSLSANAGVPLVVVQAIVGHSNPSMTSHYYHKDENVLRRATAAIPDVIDVEEDTQDSTDSGVTVIPMLPAPAEDGMLDEFKSLVAKMSQDQRLVAIEHLRSLVA